MRIKKVARSSLDFSPSSFQVIIPPRLDPFSLRPPLGTSWSLPPLLPTLHLWFLLSLLLWYLRLRGSAPTPRRRRLPPPSRLWLSDLPDLVAPGTYLRVLLATQNLPSLRGALIVVPSRVRLPRPCLGLLLLHPLLPAVLRRTEKVCAIRFPAETQLIKN